MGYAIAMYFSSDSENQIMKLAYSISEQGISNKVVDMKSKPHLALSVYDEVDEAIVKQLIDSFNFESMTLDLLGIGTFPGAENTIFLIPKVTSKLLEMHNLFHKHFSKINGCWKYYLPENWIPHCTIGINIDEENFKEAFEIVRKQFNPICVIFDKICLIKFSPVEKIYEKKI